MTISKKLTIGLFGFGIVGEGIYKVLQQTPSLNANIKKICIKHPEKKRAAPPSLFTTDAELLLADNEINVIVELIDDADAAFSIVSEALRKGKSVVSANKKMIAQNQTELLRLQKEHNVSLLYEAAVCGSVPVIRNLEEYYDNDLLNSFSGIVNGSTNYILTKMKEDKLGYNESLLLAQALGFAETDPALDVLGKDAVNKLTIVLQHAYGIIVDPGTIIHKGITFLNEKDSAFADEKGYKIKLIANAKRIDEDKIVAYVLPTFVDSGSQLYHTRNEFNGVLIGSKLADEQFLYGKGAGRYPTSSAVLSDIAALRYDYRYEYKKSKSGINYCLSNDFLIKVFVSYKNNTKLDSDAFIEIEETFRSTNRNYLIGSIKLGDLNNAGWFGDPDVSVIAIDDTTRNKAVEVLLEEEPAY